MPSRHSLLVRGRWIRCVEAGGVVPEWYHFGMATNLRLSPEAQEAVRAEAQRSGRSQQDVIRAAVNRYLSLTPESDRGRRGSELEQLIAAGAVRPPRMPYRRPRRRLTLPRGVTSNVLLDREDRF